MRKLWSLGTKIANSHFLQRDGRATMPKEQKRNRALRDQATKQRKAAAKKKKKSCPHKCPHCDYESSKKSNLDRHIQVVHEKIRPHKCPTCGKAFGQKCDLDKHSKTVHDKKMDFICSHCDQAFGQKCHLDRHIKVCTKGVLDRHMKLWPSRYVVYPEPPPRSLMDRGLDVVVSILECIF